MYNYNKGFNARSLEIARLLEREEAIITVIGDGTHAIKQSSGLNVESLKEKVCRFTSSISHSVK